jgi:hypothetical protein
MKKIHTHKELFAFITVTLLLCILFYAYTRDKIFVVGSKPFHVSRLDTFIENTDKGNSDKITIISIEKYTKLKSINLSVNQDKIITMTSSKFSDKCKAISKAHEVEGNGIIYSMTSIERQTTYTILRYKE